MNTQRQLYGIGIFEEEIVLSDFTGPAESRFIINPEQLASFVQTEVTFIPFPGLIWMKTTGTHDTYMLTLPAARRTILYKPSKKVTTKTLQLPSIAVKAEFDPSQKSVTRISMWGFTGRLKPETTLYEIPLPNLSNSSLCLGSTMRAFGGNIREAVEKTIFDTPFNHHNYLVGKERIPFHDYVKKYKGLCPLRTLKKIGIGRDILGGHR